VLVLFAVGHTSGSRKIENRWGVHATVASRKPVHSGAQDFNRTHHDFCEGFGFFVSVLLLLAAVVAWQLGGRHKETVARMPAITRGLAVCFGTVTVLSWQ
jgi:hypothetical protein